MRWRFGFVDAVLTLALGAAPGVAVAQTGAGFGSDRGVMVGGSVRTVAGAVHGGTFAAPGSAGNGGFDETLFRITVAAQPTDRVAVEVHAVQSYAYTSSGGGPGFSSGGTFGLVAGDTRYRALDATADWYQSTRQAASLWIDRANVTLTLPRADLTIGRQAISFGKTYFWNPLDEFLPFDARQFDRDFKPGVDAVRADIPTGQFSGINLVAVAGRALTASGAFRPGDAAVDLSWYGSALLGRSFATVHNWDLSAQAGKVYGGYQAGAGVSGEIKQVEVRGEAAYLWALPSAPLPAPYPGDLVENHLSAVVGVGRRFSNTLTIELEHFHNGAGERDLNASAARVASGATLQLGREITGLTISYDVLPILTGELAVLHSWSDGSTLVQPTATYSVTENSDLVAGVAVGLGAAPAPATQETPPSLRSEFGSYPRAVFAELKLYF